MKNLFLFLFFLLYYFACGQKTITEPTVPFTVYTNAGGGCDGCDLYKAGLPEKLDWQTQISSPNEPGEPLIIQGIIYQKDGKTPAPNVIMYLYHTDNNGYYSPGKNQVHGVRHGHLRSWIKTEKDGRYLFRTIRPLAYPNEIYPAHIHPTIKEPDKNEYYMDDFEFEGDPLLTEAEKKKRENRGGSGVILLTKDKNGIWQGARDIILGKNIPNYP